MRLVQMRWLESAYDVNDADIVSAIDDLSLWAAPFGLKLLDVVRLRKNIRALDIGCGLGFPTIELAGRLGDTCKVYGIDPWAAAIERARAKIRAWRLENIEIIEGKAELLPFPDAHFDLIVSNNGTNNVDDEAQTFREIRRVARPDAQIVLTMNLPATMIEFYDVFGNVLRQMDKTDELKKLDAHIHAKRKPLPHTKSVLTDAGLELVDVHEHEFTMRYADGSAMLGNHIIKLAFLRPWTGVLNPADVEQVFRAVERELNRTAEKSGSLTLTIPWVCLNCRRP
jgi:ubiquinone/menaquinone biosynthesis C-methylase UbiE